MASIFFGPPWQLLSTDPGRLVMTPTGSEKGQEEPFPPRGLSVGNGPRLCENSIVAIGQKTQPFASAQILARRIFRHHICSLGSLFLHRDFGERFSHSL